ncbi:MAG TPA: hypothetical protein VHW23_15280 [Kofleriaceae bacterium]|jgi:hypothetical protein|nr:hypothetical protein [Kofleriaceae bacterium]
MSKKWWMLAALAIAACAEGPARMEHEPDPPPPTPPALLTRTDPAPADACPRGGSVVLSGLDANSNGVLDDREVATRTVVCDDPPGQPAPLLVRLVTEPGGGGHCDRDGTAVQTGPDRNGNGQLDADEVEHVDYVCGEPLRTRIVAESPGARCPAGGVAVQAGRDRNGNGQLDDGEVEQTDVACGDVLSRDVAIQSADDAAALAGIALIDGSLTIDGSPIAALRLPQLVAIRGSLAVRHASQLASIALPALQEAVGGIEIRDNAVLADLRFPALRGADLGVFDNPHLPACQVDALFAAMHGDHQQSGNDDTAVCGP